MLDPTRLYLKPSASLSEALHIIENGGAQIALVVNDAFQLLGTVTDGDVRRALLESGDLSAEVQNIMNKEYRYMHVGASRDDAYQLMKTNRLRQIPILNTQHIVQDVILQRESSSVDLSLNPVLIMAGGKGKRLLPFTENCPKPMLPLGKKPILEILIDKLRSQGLNQIFISVNYLKDVIIEYFGDGSRFGVSIEYLVEHEPLGTAGSLSLLPSTITHPILIINGDVVTDFNTSRLFEFHHEHHAVATLCVRQNEIQIPYGVVETKNCELISFEEKPQLSYLVNAGIYVLDPSLLQLVKPHTFMDMPNLILSAKSNGLHVVVCPIHEYWLDVGLPDTLKKARLDWAGI